MANKKVKAFPPLFKHTARQGTQVWEIWVEPYTETGGVFAQHYAKMVTRYGLVDGKKQTVEEIISKGKNTGKKNATTPLEQACAEAEARWEKQKSRNGYGLTAEESAAVRAVSPMLAHTYDKHAKKVSWDTAFAQPKLDGFRCLAHLGPNGLVTLLSRENQPLLALDHLAAVLADTNLEAGSVILDGELYRHGMSLNEISSACKRKSEKTEKIQYHVYDAILADGSAQFQERADFVRRLVAMAATDVIKDVETVKVRSDAELVVCQQRFLEAGFEGAMLRHGTAGYQAGKRSDTLLKVKNWSDAEFKVVDWKLGRGKMADVPTFTCETPEGNHFDVLAPGSMEEKKALGLAATALVGKMLTVRYAYFTKTEEPVPFLPVAKAFVE